MRGTVRGTGDLAVSKTETGKNNNKMVLIATAIKHIL